MQWAHERMLEQIGLTEDEYKKQFNEMFNGFSERYHEEIKLNGRSMRNPKPSILRICITKPHKTKRSK